MAQKDLYGYFYKVFTDMVQIPDPQYLYWPTYVEDCLNRAKLNKKAASIIKSLFAENSSLKSKEFDIYQPSLLRTLKRSLKGLISLMNGPLANLTLNAQDELFCKRILVLAHFFHCMAEESPDLYMRLKNATTESVADVLRLTLINNSAKANNDTLPERIDPNSADYKMLDYILKHAFKNPSLEWKNETLKAILKGVIYSTVHPSQNEIIEAFEESLKHNSPINLKHHLECEERYVIGIFWQRVTSFLWLNEELSTTIISEDSYIKVVSCNLKQVREYAETITSIFIRFIQTITKNSKSTVSPRDVITYPLREKAFKYVINSIDVNYSLKALEKIEHHIRSTKPLIPILKERIFDFFSNDISSAHQCLSIGKLRSILELYIKALGHFDEKERREAFHPKTSCSLLMIICLACLASWRNPNVPMANSGRDSSLSAMFTSKFSLFNVNNIAKNNILSEYEEYFTRFRNQYNKDKDRLSTTNAANSKAIVDIINKLI